MPRKTKKVKEQFENEQIDELLSIDTLKPKKRAGKIKIVEETSTALQDMEKYLKTLQVYKLGIVKF